MTDSATVWIVDDDEAIRFVLERALGRAGHQVKLFTNVQDVVSALKTSSPQVIVTDIHLPDADGLVVLDTLREQNKEIPVIAMTGYSDLDQAVTAFKQGVFDYIPKPFSIEELAARVRTHLRAHHTRHELEIKKRELEAQARLRQVIDDRACAAEVLERRAQKPVGPSLSGGHDEDAFTNDERDADSARTPKKRPRIAWCRPRRKGGGSKRKSGRAGEIRTRDPLSPRQVRYQAALRPD